MLFRSLINRLLHSYFIRVLALESVKRFECFLIVLGPRSAIVLFVYCGELCRDVWSRSSIRNALGSECSSSRVISVSSRIYFFFQIVVNHLHTRKKSSAVASIGIPRKRMNEALSRCMAQSQTDSYKLLALKHS